VPRHRLLGGWYPRGLIVYQQRYQPSDSNKNVDIKCIAHVAFLFFTFLHFRQSEQILYCSAKFQISNITKILKLENRPMIINIFLPSWFPISFIRLQFEALKYTIPHNYIFTILYLFLKYLTLSESDEGYSRNATCAIHFISTFLLLSLGWFLWCSKFEIWLNNRVFVLIVENEEM
jgi:hypothetical protein